MLTFIHYNIFEVNILIFTGNDRSIVQIQKFPRPAFLQGEAVLFVEARGDAWVDLKIG